MNNFRLIQISTFIAVAELKNFRLAADRLNISPPAVSTRIRQLEDQLGLRLLNRTTRSVSLTPEGERLLVAATDALAELNRVTNQLQDEVHLKSGRITLAVIETLIVTTIPDLLTAFQERYPGIFVVVQDLMSDLVVDAVRSGAADIGLVSWFPERRDIKFEPLLRDAVLVVVGTRHPWSKRETTNLAEIAEQPLVLPPRGTGFREFIEGVFIRAGLNLVAEREVQSLPAHIALAAAGHGISLIPASSAWLADLSKCHLLRIEPETVQRIVGMATATNRSLSPAAQALQALIRERLSNYSGYIGEMPLDPTENPSGAIVP